MVDALRRAGIPCAVVDLHHETVTPAIDEGVPAVWGDVGHEDILRAACIVHARMLVLAVSVLPRLEVPGRVSQR